LWKWRAHFERILNVVSSFNQSTFDGVEKLPLKRKLAEPPDRDEILRALM